MNTNCPTDISASVSSGYYNPTLHTLYIAQMCKKYNPKELILVYKCYKTLQICQYF